MKKPRSIILRTACVVIIGVVALGNQRAWPGFIRQCVLQGDGVATINQVATVAAQPRSFKYSTEIEIAIAELGSTSWCRVRAYVRNTRTASDSRIVKGDRVRLSAEIERAQTQYEEGSYTGYLKARGVEYVANKAEVQTLQWGKDETESRDTTRRVITAGLERLRTAMKERVGSLLAQPYAGIVLALALGDKTQLSDHTKETFAAAGLSHVLAISGLHITMLVTAVRTSLLRGGLRRRTASLVASLLLCGYIVLIGGTISAIRAALMGSVVLLGEHIGVPTNGLNVLCVLAAVFIVLNPYIALYDIGFQLSFLATAGILIALRPLERLLKKVRVPNILQLRTNIALTVAASLFTAPVVLTQFGKLPLQSILANIAVVPALPMLFLGIVATMLCGDHCAWASWSIIEYILRVAEWVGSLEHFTIIWPFFTN